MTLGFQTNFFRKEIHPEACRCLQRGQRKKFSIYTIYISKIQVHHPLRHNHEFSILNYDFGCGLLYNLKVLRPLTFANNSSNIVQTTSHFAAITALFVVHLSITIAVRLSGCSLRSTHCTLAVAVAVIFPRLPLPHP